MRGPRCPSLNVVKSSLNVAKSTPKLMKRLLKRLIKRLFHYCQVILLIIVTSTFCFRDRGETEWIGNDLGASEHYTYSISGRFLSRKSNWRQA